MSVQGPSIFLLVLLLLAAVALVLLALRSRADRPRSAAPASAVPLAVGALLVLIVTGAETIALLSPVGDVADGGEVELRLAASADDRAAPDRLQLLFVVADRSGLLPATSIDSRVLPLPAGGGWVEFEADELGTEGSLSLSAADDLTELDYRVTTWVGLDHHSTSGGGAYRGALDVGDGRGVARFVDDHPVSHGLRLRRTDGAGLSIYARVLREGEELVRVPFEEARAALVGDLEARAFELPFQRALAPFPPSAVKRMLSELAPVGTVLFVFGLGLILYRRASLLRGASLLTLGLVVVTGGFARVDSSRVEGALRAEDPATRLAATARLARSRAFPVRAANALEDAYARETAPTRKGMTLQLAAEGGNPLRRLPAIRRAREAAAGSADERLRALAGKIAALDDRG